MIKIYDDFLDDDLYDRLGDTSMTFSEVQWIGRFAKPENAFHAQKFYQMMPDTTKGLTTESFRFLAQTVGFHVNF